MPLIDLTHDDTGSVAAIGYIGSAVRVDMKPLKKLSDTMTLVEEKMESAE